MKKDLSQQGLSVFEQIKQTDENGNEFWMARQLAKALDYTDFRNFSGVIEKAAEACKNSDHNPLEHIVEANEVLTAGQGAKQTYTSYKLSRYTCYRENDKKTILLLLTGWYLTKPAKTVRQATENNLLTALPF